MNLKKILVSSLLLAGIAMSPHALAVQSFDGSTINAAFGIWDSNDAVNGGDVLFEITREKDVLASDLVYPDEKDFYVIDRFSHYFDWDIDFNENRIELTYVSIKADDAYHRYIYTWSKGFRFRDSENSLPDIINVSVDSTFAPLGFDPELVTFDANNIYVNLKDSRCLWSKIPVEGSNDLVSECVNLLSPTGFNNRIKLTVEFADDPTNDKVIIDQATIDELYDWLESKYPEYLPTHQDSFYIQGYYARYYPEYEIYVGSLEGSLYVYGTPFGGLLELGELSHWVEEMKKETELVTGNK